MSKTARRKTSNLSWQKYERKASVRLQANPKKKKLKPKRSNNQIALGLTAIFFLVTLILIGKIFGFLGGLNLPVQTHNQQKLNSWDTETDFNLVVKADNTYLLSYQPNGKELTIIKFQDDIYLDLPYGFGKWPMRSIYDLGQAEKPPMGAVLLRDSINTSFGILADGYMILNDNSKSLPDIVDTERKSLVPGADLLSKSKTDLDLFEFMKAWWAIKEVRGDKIRVIDLEKSELTQWLLQPDGSRVIVPDKVKLDDFAQGFFETEKIKNEGLSVGIYNATDVSGLAERVAQILTNMGAKVIFTSNAPDKLIKSTILAKKSFTTEYVSKMLNLYCPVAKGSSISQNLPFIGSGGGDCATDNISLDTGRADITVILGEDTFLKYEK